MRNSPDPIFAYAMAEPAAGGSNPDEDGAPDSLKRAHYWLDDMYESLATVIDEHEQTKKADEDESEAERIIAKTRAWPQRCRNCAKS